MAAGPARALWHPGAMNLLILEPGDLTGPHHARVEGRRFLHAVAVLKAQGGSRLRAGLLGGDLGTAEVVSRSESHLELRLHLEEPPPSKLPLDLLLALPRPKVLHRVLASAASLGIARIVLINAWKVEKAYWKSPRLEAGNLRAQLLLGLEQARDTVLPDLRLARLFRPFVEEELPALLAGRRALLADPAGAGPCPRGLDRPTLLAIGPEGGWMDAERASLGRAGFEAVTLGSRILRTETALAALVGRLA